jgi:hypothetical protein
MAIKKKPEAWQVRRIAYGLAAVIIGVLGWVGVLSDVKADDILGQVDQWLPILLGVLAPALAATKTHSGSDSTATDADAEAAMIAGTATTLQDHLEDAVRDALSRIPGTDQIGQAVVAAIRAEERGETGTHETTPTVEQTSTPVDAPGDDYVYGR